MPFTYAQINEEHLLLIGKIIGECGYLESIIQVLIWKVAEIDSTAGRSLTTHMGLRDKLHALSSLSSFKYDNNEIQRIVKKINTISTERNKLVHNPWYSIGDTNELESSIFSARGKLKVDIKILTTEQLQSLLDDITQASSDMHIVMQRYFEPSQEQDK